MQNAESGRIWNKAIEHIFTSHRFQILIDIWMDLPAMLYMTRRVGASFSYWLIMPFWAALGTGMVSVMAVWNRRRRGSRVTIGLTATRFPRSLDTSSGETGWAYCSRLKKIYIKNSQSFQFLNWYQLNSDILIEWMNFFFMMGSDENVTWFHLEEWSFSDPNVQVFFVCISLKSTWIHNIYIHHIPLH